MDYGTRPGVHKATNFRIFFVFQKKALQEKSRSGNFYVIPKLYPERRTGTGYLLPYSVKISSEKKRQVLILAGMVLPDGATTQKCQHTSLRGYEHLCDSIATITTDTDATLHSTPRKRSRFIITLNTPYLLSFVIAHSNSKKHGSISRVCFPHKQTRKFAFQNGLFQCTKPDILQRPFNPLSFASTSQRSGSQENMIDCRPRSKTCCDDV